MDASDLENICPRCGYYSDAVSIAKGEHRMPIPGDFNVCIQCGELSVFDENLKLVMPDLHAVLELQTKAPEQWKILEKAQAFIHNRGPIPGALERHRKKK